MFHITLDNITNNQVVSVWTLTDRGYTTPEGASRALINSMGQEGVNYALISRSADGRAIHTRIPHAPNCERVYRIVER